MMIIEENESNNEESGTSSNLSEYIGARSEIKTISEKTNNRGTFSK